MTEDEIIDGIIAREGGYVDHPADRGGPTNYGITLATLRKWRHDPDLTAKDVFELSREDARRIYRTIFITQPRLHLIESEHLRTNLIDFGVMIGPADAVVYLQRILGVKADGDIGPVTLAALRRVGNIKVNNLFTQTRCMHHARDVRKNPKQAAFIVGWLDRAFGFMI